MKKGLKILWKFVVTVAALLFLVWILVQMPVVQTFLAQKAVQSLEGKINGRIEFTKVHVRPFDAVVLKDVAILDNDPATTAEGEKLDTILSAKNVVVTFSLKGLFKKEGLHVRRASISGATATITREERGSNIKRLINQTPADSTAKKDKKTSGKIFDIGRVSLSDVRFRMIDPSDTLKTEGAFNPKHIDVRLDEAKAHGLVLAGGIFSGVLDKLAASESCGVKVQEMSGKVRAGKGKITVEDFHLQDEFSTVDVPEMAFNNGKAENADEEVIAVISKTRVSSRTIAYFVPLLKDKPLTFDIDKADVKGRMDDIVINRVEFKEEGTGIKGAIEGHVTGLPNLQATDLDLYVDNLTFTTAGVGSLLNTFVPKMKVNLSKFASGETLTFNGHGRGTLNKLKFNGDLKSAIGSAQADITASSLIKKGTAPEIEGSFSTSNLDIGKIAGLKQIGEVTARTVLDAKIAKGQTQIQIDSLFVDKLSALGYDYSNIMAAGTYSDKAFDGRVICNDPNLNFLFQGIFTLSDKTQNGLYKFYANLGYADLNALHLDKRGTSKVSGEINANYMTIAKTELIGDLDILDLKLEDDQGVHNVGDICLKSHSSDALHRMNLTSSFLNGNYIGSKPVTTFISDLQDLTTRRELPVLYKDATAKWAGDSYSLHLNVSDARDVLAFVKNGLYIADSTRVDLSVTKEGGVWASVISPRIAFGRNYFKNFGVTLDNSNGKLNGTVRSSEITASALRFLGSAISITADDDDVDLGISYDNNLLSESKGNVHFCGKLDRAGDGDLLTHLQVLPSSIVYDGKSWNIPTSAIEIEGKDISITDKLTGSCGEQRISIFGGFASTKSDTLGIELQKLDLTLLDRITAKDYGFGGKATGRAFITSPWKGNAGLMMNMTCDSTRFSNENVGTLRLASTLDEDGKMHIVARTDLDGKKTIDVHADYMTRSGEIVANAGLDGLNAAYFKPFLTSVFSDMEGSINANVKAEGKLNDLKISTEGGMLDDVQLKVAYTNVPYWCDGPFHVDNQGVHFDDIAISDIEDGTGTVSGGIYWERFKNIRMDTHVRMNRAQAVDLRENQNQYFYGNLFATGNVDITGPFSALNLNVDVRTDGDGNVHIPIGNSSNAKKSELLTFKEPEKVVYVDPYDVMMNNIVAKKKKSKDLGIRIRVQASPTTEAFVEIDRSEGNVLSGHGQGTIEMDIRPNRHSFAINGDYTLNEGNFHFNAMDIAKRNFKISSGSSIRFNGDVMDSDLDIDGLYSTKASIATLISDTTAVSTRRQVNCGVSISGKLRNPQLSFDIDVPDLDPTTKSKVESALNTDDKIQKQFLALLISNSFMPDESSGIVNNSTMIYSNMAEIMAGQLNSILQKLDIPLDLGLNYQSTESGNSVFDVAVSTQLFNNRVLINGAFGNREYSNSNSESDVTGDIDVEVKMDKSGQLLLTLFSHSADDYTSYLDNTQRSGIGIALQKEFNTIREFLRDLFTGRRRKERMRKEMEERLESQSAPDRHYKTLTITREDGRKKK